MKSGFAEISRIRAVGQQSALQTQLLHLLSNILLLFLRKLLICLGLAAFALSTALR